MTSQVRLRYVIEAQAGAAVFLPEYISYTTCECIVSLNIIPEHPDTQYSEIFRAADSWHTCPPKNFDLLLHIDIGLHTLNIDLYMYI